MTQCEACCFYNYDEDYDEYICDVDLDEDEIDQGQHDDREDVLAVGTAGMLVRPAVWDELGGTDPVRRVHHRHRATKPHHPRGLTPTDP